jgi:hypothetical protein
MITLDALHHILAFVLGIAATILFEFLKDRIVVSIRKWIAKRAILRYKQSQVPSPHKDFPLFRIGNIQLPLANILGSPGTPFLFDEVDISFRPEFIQARPDYPLELKAAQDFLFEHIAKIQDLKKDEIADIMPRLDNIVQGHEQPGDKRGRLNIQLSLTTFGSLFTTNRSIDCKVIPARGLVAQLFKSISIRDAYCQKSETDLSQSLLANPPGVDVSIISRNVNQDPQNQFIIRRRSNQVLLFKDYYQVAATGYLSLAHCDSKGVPNPFVTAITEAKQEVADCLELTTADFKLIGIAVKWEDLHPGFYGYIETGKSVAELLGDFRRDSYEGTLSAIPFDPLHVVKHIAGEKWHPVSALSAISALLAFFPRAEVEAVAREVPAKSLRSYFEEC